MVLEKNDEHTIPHITNQEVLDKNNQQLKIIKKRQLGSLDMRSEDDIRKKQDIHRYQTPPRYRIAASGSRLKV